MEKLIHIYAEAAGNTFLQLVLIAVVIDTIFGVLRAIKERRFNSNFGINGAIRKCGMLVLPSCTGYGGSYCSGKPDRFHSAGSARSNGGRQDRNNGVLRDPFCSL